MSPCAHWTTSNKTMMVSTINKIANAIEELEEECNMLKLTENKYKQTYIAMLCNKQVHLSEEKKHALMKILLKV